MRYRLIIPVFRSPHSAEYTARGVANGVFWGFTPSIGAQSVLLVATWFIGRRAFGRDSSLLQAALWAWINNPLTALPLYYTFYVTGLALTGQSVRGIEYGDFTITNVAALGFPLVVGCLPYACAFSALAYWWALRVVRQRKTRLALRREEYGTFRTSDPSG
jgi:uncharacterized protein